MTSQRLRAPRQQHETAEENRETRRSPHLTKTNPAIQRQQDWTYGHVKQAVVDTVTVVSCDLRRAHPDCWKSIETVHGRLQATDWNGDVLEVDSNTLQTLTKKPAVFQTCSECKKKIEYFYRSVRHKNIEVAFVKCSCSRLPVVLKDGEVIGRLKIQFDSTRADTDTYDQNYNRSVWSTSTALLYCEKTSRLVVEYQWKDLEAGQFDKHSVKLSGIKSPSKTADIVIEGDAISFLLKDGSVALIGFRSRNYGTV